MNSKIETLCLHGGHDVDSDTLSRAVPIYQTTSYLFVEQRPLSPFHRAERGLPRPPLLGGVRKRTSGVNPGFSPGIEAKR